MRLKGSLMVISLLFLSLIWGVVAISEAGEGIERKRKLMTVTMPALRKLIIFLAVAFFGFLMFSLSV